LGNQVSRDKAPKSIRQITPPNPEILGSLPPGWDCAVDPKGRTYFIDHNSRSTTYEDPRLRQSKNTLQH